MTTVTTSQKKTQPYEVKTDEQVRSHARDHAAYNWSMRPGWWPPEQIQIYKDEYIHYRAELKAKGAL